MSLPAPPPPGGYYSNVRQAGVRIGVAGLGFSADYSSPMAEFETTIETPNGYKVTHCFRSSNRDDVRAVAYDSLQAVLQAAARAELQSRMIDAGFSRDLVELLWGDSRPQWQLPRR